MSSWYSGGNASVVAKSKPISATWAWSFTAGAAPPIQASSEPSSSTGTFSP